MPDSSLALWYHFASSKSLEPIAGLGPTLVCTRADATGTIINSQGLVETVAANAGRFDHSESNGQSLGLLVEESRENVCLHNRDGTDAAWVKTNMTPVKDQVGEDGVANSATSLLATAANATAIQSFTIVSTEQTGTFSIKRLIGSGTVEITIDDGVTFIPVSINSLTWTRFDVTQTLANPDIGVRLVTSGDKIAIDFQGLEAGAFPTSRIATVASSVARNKDDINTTIVDWYNEAAGIFYGRGSQLNLSGGTPKLCEAAGSASNRFHLSLSSLSKPQLVVRTGGTNVVVLLASAAITAGVEFEMAAGATLNDAELFVDGLRTDTGDQVLTMPAGISTFNVGSNRTEAEQFNGHMAEIRYYNDYEGGANGRQFLEDLSNRLISESSGKGPYPIGLSSDGYFSP